MLFCYFMHCCFCMTLNDFKSSEMCFSKNFEKCRCSDVFRNMKICEKGGLCWGGGINLQ